MNLKQKFVIAFSILAALGIGIAVPVLASGTAQSAPVENSIFPVLLQIAAIVLIAEGVKSLARAFGLADLADRAAAVAYIVVAVVVYAVEKFLVPLLDAANAALLVDFLQFLALVLAGSGLFQMTSAFRIRRGE